MTEIKALIKERLAQRFLLNDDQQEQLSAYYELLIDWNKHINLTAITEPEQVVEKHFFDSLLVLEAVDLGEKKQLIDVGTGAGFPGMVLAIARPTLSVTLLDSLNKRIHFLDEVAQQLGLSNVTTVHERAELAAKKPAYREQFDWAVARAVARLPLLLEYTLPFVKVGGGFLACKGPDGHEELSEAQKALDILGGVHHQTHTTQLQNGDKRLILTIQKQKPTPTKYPRNPNATKKNPLI